jgi:hypothetical protein
MSNWIEHLEELASVETDVKKKVAFQSSVKLIKELAKGGAELRKELAALKQSIPKLKGYAIRDFADYMQDPEIDPRGFNERAVNLASEYANEIEDGS